MKKKWIGVFFVCTVLIGCTLLGPLMSNVEQPIYEVESSQESCEIRRYAPMILAEVTLEGSRQESISAGFRLLADYIFGNNLVDERIAMTAPVQQERSQQIAMTAPVQQQEVDGAWKVHFVMPSQYSLETLPKPRDKRVSLIQIPTKRYIVITFSGTSSDANINEHEQRLKAFIQANKLLTVGSPKYAFYNPPWTLPFLRRNEILIELGN